MSRARCVPASCRSWRAWAPSRAQILTALVLGAFLLFVSAAQAATPLAADDVIVPNATPKTAPAPGAPGGTGTLTFVAVVLLGCAGGWMLWRGRGGPLKLGGTGRAARQLAVEETKGLGNRQFLVVASYQNRKFLLGVCPGRIDLLAPLSDAAVLPEKSRE